MTGLDTESDPQWISNLKSNGPLPLLDLNNCSNGWASPPGDCFMVRGPDYLQSKVKITGGECLLKPLAFDWLKGPTKIHQILNYPNGRVRKALEEACSECEGKNKPFVWAFNLQVPSKDNHTAVAYFVSLDPITEGSLMDQFLKGDDAYRNSRLKLIANIVKGPWIVRTAVGEQAICILGRAVSCKYVFGENFIEVDVDIGASMVANAIVHLAFGYITSLTVDLAFLIESQTEAELPERILGAVRFSELDPNSAETVELPYEGFPESSKSSLPTSFWKSIGQGFSHLLHQGSSGEIPSASTIGGENSNLPNGIEKLNDEGIKDMNQRSSSTSSEDSSEFLPANGDDSDKHNGFDENKEDGSSNPHKNS